MAYLNTYSTHSLPSGYIVRDWLHDLNQQHRDLVNRSFHKTLNDLKRGTVSMEYVNGLFVIYTNYPELKTAFEKRHEELVAARIRAAPHSFRLVVQADEEARRFIPIVEEGFRRKWNQEYGLDLTLGSSLSSVEAEHTPYTLLASVTLEYVCYV